MADQRGRRAPSASPAPQKIRAPGLLVFLIGSLGALAPLGALCAAVLAIAIEERTASLHAGLRERLHTSAEERAQTIATWLEGTAQLGRRLTRSDLVRLFASETAQTDARQPPVRWLADQVPYMTRVLSEFAAQHDLLGAALLGRDGQILLATRNAPLPERRSWAERMTLLSGPADRLVMPIRRLEAAAAGQSGHAPLALDVLLPVPWAESMAQTPPTFLPSALVMTVPVDERLAQVLASGPDGARRAWLIQLGPDGLEQIAGHPLPELTPLGAQLTIVPGKGMGYRRLLDASGVELLGAGAGVPGLPWTVLQVMDAPAALAPVQAYRKKAGMLAAGAALSVWLLFGAVWGRQRVVHSRRLVRQEQTLVRQHDRILRSIANAIPGVIALKTLDGRCTYVDPAFAGMLDRPAEKRAGRAGEEIGAPKLADQFADAVDRARRDGAAETSPRATRLKVDTGEVAGLLAHEAVEAERQIQRALIDRQIVTVLLRAIELRDPRLLDHTQRLRTYALALGRRLDLGARELATLELAADLSQIGRAFAPERPVKQAESGTERPAPAVEAEVERTLAILAPIDFDLPVADVIAQMHERLDGSGHPRGLRGEQIGLLARLLGAVDVFCTRRSWRNGHARLSPGEGLYHLAVNPHRFDMRIVSALATMVAEGRYGGDAREEAAAGRRAHSGPPAKEAA